MTVPESQSLATRTIRGVFWTGSAFSLQIVTTFVFFRFLTLEQMGQFGVSLMVVMFLALLCDLGLGSALVQDRDAGEEHFNAAFWICLVFGLITTCIIILSASAATDLLSPKDPTKFEPVLRGMVLLVPFAAVSGLFRARLQRDLRWRAMAAAEIASSVLHAITAFGLLAAGYGVMSTVHSAVAREAALLVGLAWMARWLPSPRIRLDAVRRILTFGLNLTGSRCLNYVNSNLAKGVLYVALGEAAIAVYDFAYRLTLMPLVRISTVITRVFFPTFSAIGNDDELLRRTYLRSVQAVALAYWPALAALFVLAEPVALFADADMGPAIWPLRLLALATIIKAVGAAVGSVFLAKGRANWALYWSIFSLIILIPALKWGGTHGVVGVCAVIALTAVLFLALSQHLANRLMAIGFGTYLAVLWRPALVTAATGVTVLAVSPWLPTPPLLACAAGGSIAAIAWLAAIRLFAWDSVAEMVRSARGTADDPGP